LMGSINQDENSIDLARQPAVVSSNRTQPLLLR